MLYAMALNSSLNWASAVAADYAVAAIPFRLTKGGWGENYDREWDMLSNCMSMAIEEERIQRVKIAKLEQDLQILKLEVGCDLWLQVTMRSLAWSMCDNW